MLGWNCVDMAVLCCSCQQSVSSCTGIYEATVSATVHQQERLLFDIVWNGRRLDRPITLDMWQTGWEPNQAVAQQVPSPASYTAALLMAGTAAPLSPPAAVEAAMSGQALLGRPLGLPLSSPALVQPGEHYSYSKLS